MHRAIETVPKDGKVVILEDDRGTYELARWSAEARTWVKENGEPSKIMPKYWHATRRDEYLLQEGDEFLMQKESGSSGPSASRERRTLPSPPHRAEPQGAPAAVDGIALRELAKADPVAIARLEERAALGKAKRGPSARRISSIAAAMVAALLIGLYFSDEIAPYVTRYAGQQDTVRVGAAGVQVVDQETRFPSQDSPRDPARHQQAEADRANSGTAWESAQVKQAADAMRPEAQQPLEQERRRAASPTAELRQSLQKEHDRAEALASELARSQRDLETQAVPGSKTRDEAAQLKQVKKTPTAELRQSLQKEHDRAEAVASEVARAERDIETQVALASKTGDEAEQLKQLKQAAESTMAELRQSLQKEHDRAEALAGELAKAQRDIGTQGALASKTGDEAAQLEQPKQAARGALGEPRQGRQKEGARPGALAAEGAGGAPPAAG